MSNICASIIYRVKFIDKFSYNTPTSDCPNDWHNETERRILNMYGGKLAEYISKLLTDENFLEISWGENEVSVSLFDSYTGETEDVQIKWTYNEKATERARHKIRLANKNKSKENKGI